jgi:murein DD-endopeptidase MepM/ murein hydrolase activator NlpD
MKNLVILIFIGFLFTLIPIKTCGKTNPTQHKPENTITSYTPEVKISAPKPFIQGSSAIIYVKSDNTLIDPVITFNGKTSPLYKISDNQYRGMVAIDAQAKPGGYTVKAKDTSGKLSYSKVLEVYPGHFPIQNIRISGSKASLEATEDELQKVSAAKENVSDLNYWSTRPFTNPTSGCVISVFGLNRYHNGKPTGDYHKGLDIKAPPGNPIVAMAGGKVLIAEPFRLHGKTVAIDHGQGLMSIYIHMNHIDVKQGDVVTQGQKIGTVGSTGFATGPHLHWGVYVNGQATNPQDWIQPARKCW